MYLNIRMIQMDENININSEERMSIESPKKDQRSKNLEFLLISEETIEIESSKQLQVTESQYVSRNTYHKQCMLWRTRGDKHFPGESHTRESTNLKTEIQNDKV